MNAPLSDYWVVEYHYSGNSFSVRPLPDYLSQSQKNFRAGKWFDSAILSIHPNQAGARETCDGWQDERDKNPLSVEARIEELNRYTDGLKTQL